MYMGNKDGWTGYIGKVSFSLSLVFVLLSDMPISRKGLQGEEMNGKLCLNCEFIIHEGCGIGIEFHHCQHPSLENKNNYIWFMDESECPKKRVD